MHILEINKYKSKILFRKATNNGKREPRNIGWLGTLTCVTAIESAPHSTRVAAHDITLFPTLIVLVTDICTNILDDPGALDTDDLRQVNKREKKKHISDFQLGSSLRFKDEYRTFGNLTASPDPPARVMSSARLSPGRRSS